VRKGRPCGLAKHVAFWKSQSAAAAKDKQEEEEAADEDNDDHSSVVSADGFAVSHVDSNDEEDEEGEEGEEPSSPPPGASAAVLPAPASPASSSSSSSTKKLTYLHSEEMRWTAQRLLEEYFSKPFNPELKKVCSVDWELVVPPGNVRVQRPNHGMVHSVRVAMAVPLALRLLLLEMKQPSQLVRARDVFCAQYMTLFTVVGRGNEISFMNASLLQQKQLDQGVKDPEHLYEKFKLEGKLTLITFLHRRPPASLRLSKTEQQAWINALDIGKPNLSDVFGQAMKLAHDADLMRCYSTLEFDNKKADLAESLGASGATILCDYMYALNQATGDRCWGYKSFRKYHDHQLFPRYSHDYDALLAALCTVPQPLQEHHFKNDPYAEEEEEEGEDDDNDDKTSVSSAGSSVFSSLMEAFQGRLKINGDDDISVHEQLRFGHSLAITNFRSTPSCVRCFYKDNGLNHDIVTNAYTAPNLFKDLNRALCQRYSDTFLKMYSLLLCKAITDASHDIIPAVVWRGVGYSQELLEMYASHVGRVIWLYSFTSTSRSQPVAQKWANKKVKEKEGATATVIEIRLPLACRAAAADVASRSQYPEELEILLACNAGYKIEQVDVAGCRIVLALVDITKCGLGNLPRKLCGEHKMIADDEKWEAGAAAAAE
jgi:hypothetical protein